MNDLGELESRLRRLVPSLAESVGVPGVAVAIAHGGDQFFVYTGAANDAGRPVDDRSIFEIGSITKIWTATAAMQLVDEGRVALDDLVVSVLPSFRLEDPDVSRQITIRHLLTHATGFDGDVFVDTGESDGGIERYVNALVTIKPYGAPGILFSYCNAGMVVLGRVVEVLRGMPYDDVLRTHLIEPLGLSNAYTDPFQAPVGFVVTGHAQPGGQVVPLGAMPRGMSPTGTRLSMTASDLLTFGQLHAQLAPRPGDVPLLSSAALRDMRTPQPVTVPPLGPNYGARGLGWSIETLSGTAVLSHNGHTRGQVAALRVVPDRDLVIVVLTNGGDAYTVIDEVVTSALYGAAGLRSEPPIVPQQESSPVEVPTYDGTYEGYASRHRVSRANDGKLWMTSTYADSLGSAPPTRVELQHVSGDTFLAVVDDCGRYPIFTFVRSDDGSVAFLHGGRAVPRVADAIL